MISFFKHLVYLTLRVGLEKSDSEAVQLKKISITMVPVIIAPVGLIWSIIYFFMGYPLSASIPLAYTLASIVTVYIFFKTKNITFMLMWSLGGFTQSSYIFMWAFFAPVTALIHDKSNKALYWLYAFIALVVFSAFVDAWLRSYIIINLPTGVSEVFFILNISVALAGIYFLIKYFIDQNDKNAEELLCTKNDALMKNTNQLYDNMSYLESYKTSIDNILIVTRTDKKGIITFANKNFYNISAYTQEEVIGSSHSLTRHPNVSSTLFCELWQTITSKKTWHGTIENLGKNGTIYWVDTTISPILNKDNEIVEFIAIHHDVTKLIRHQDELIALLYTDTLTGLKNRNALLRDIKTEKDLSCTLINIDNFSQVNSLYGEVFGNQLLVKFSEFLDVNALKDPKAKLYRLSGDEFVVLCEETDTVLLKNKAQELLHACMNSVIPLDENNLKWIKEIKSAIQDDRITMYFQPIIDNNNHNEQKYESLVRLVKKDGEVISPYYFLEIAKKAKLYKDITKIVINKTFEAFKDNEYEFSLNLTIDDILDKDIKAHILKQLAKYKISKRVIFELVESEGIEDFDEIERFIKEIKLLGCRIAIDDFGTGYSNFEHLMRLQADLIKIDGSIIKELITNKCSELITSVIVAFANEMNIQTIGEFVETKEVHDKLIELGVDKSQGYYFDKPLKELH